MGILEEKDERFQERHKWRTMRVMSKMCAGTFQGAVARPARAKKDLLAHTSRWLR